MHFTKKQLRNILITKQVILIVCIFAIKSYKEVYANKQYGLAVDKLYVVTLRACSSCKPRATCKLNVIILSSKSSVTLG